MADALRGSMDAAEYKHVVLGLIFLKYISDAFEERHAQLKVEDLDDPEDPDAYRGWNLFWVPLEARWSYLKGQARQPSIGRLVDDAMAGIERDNPRAGGRAAHGLRPPKFGQDPPGAAHRPHQQYPDWGRGVPLQGRAGPGVRVLPLPSSPAQRVRRAANSIRRAAWSGC